MPDAPSELSAAAKRRLDPRLGLLACVVASAAVGLGGRALGMAPGASTMAGLATLMATCWVTEVLPIPVTSLLPLALFPLFGVLDVKKTAASYGKPVIFLFLGGFLLALALSRSRLHRRIALRIVVAVGSDPARLVLGFMLACALLSMWISNTASVLVMMPIGLAVLEEARSAGVPREAVARLGTAMMLGIAYAADIGGMATPVGTPPNLVLLELYAEVAPEKPPIGFGQWMTMGLPLAALFLSTGWLLLAKVLFRFPKGALFGGEDVVRQSLDSLGRIRRDEALTGGVFATTALLWMTGEDLRLGSLTVPGWRGALGLSELDDASVAVAAAALLFVLPSRDHEGESLLTWADTKDVPWGLLLLFGGGFALAAGFSDSGLSAAIGEALAGLRGLHPVLVVLVVCTALTFLTEVTSNTATTTLVLPILAQAAVALRMDPLLLMIPATLSASCAFMMPVASPTQAVVFGSGYVEIRQMARAGLAFNVLGVALVTLVFLALATPVFGIAW